MISTCLREISPAANASDVTGSDSNARANVTDERVRRGGQIALRPQPCRRTYEPVRLPLARSFGLAHRRQPRALESFDHPAQAHDVGGAFARQQLVDCSFDVRQSVEHMFVS